jgi:hypothetical protein
VQNEIALVEPGKTNPIDVGDGVKFGGVLNPSIKIDCARSWLNWGNNELAVMSCSPRTSRGSVAPSAGWKG